MLVLYIDMRTTAEIVHGVRHPLMLPEILKRQKSIITFHANKVS